MENIPINDNRSKIIKSVIIVIIGLICFFVFAKLASSPDLFDKTLQSIDEKRNAVIELMTASTASSVALSLLPGDIATPVAEKMADLSGYFLIALVAIYIEKYLVTISGLLAFRVLVPGACLFGLWSIWSEKERAERCKTLAKKLTLLGISIWLVVPISVCVTNVIDDTSAVYMEQAIQEAQQYAEDIQADSEASNNDEDNFISRLVSKLQGGVKAYVEKYETILNVFIESIAVMIVTTCIIPISVILLFLWLIKLITGIDLNLPINRKLFKK